MRDSELRYRLLWETSSDAVILMDTKSRIHFANPAVFDVFGYNPQEIVGQSLTLLQPDRLRGAHVAGIDRYLRTGVKKLNWRATETVGRRKDGAEIPIEVSFSDMEFGGARWFVGFVRDITERKRAEEELRENQEQFRWFTHDAAAREGIHGWVRNLADGSVEVVAEGEQESLRRFEAAVRRGPASARVETVETEVGASS